jgi:sulfite reductase (NADPH) flavoprotein alpha-component
MSSLVPHLPECAPFPPPVRAFIDGWLAGYFATLEGSTPPAAPAEAEEEFPWHDMALALEERLRLAEGRPLARVLMAATAQQDCGQCGYLCKTYAEAIASGAEKSLVKCVPGGKETARKLKELMEAAPLAAAAVAPAPPSPDSASASPSRPAFARFEAAHPLNRAGSGKDTRQVVLDLSESALTYEVGDSLGVRPTNCQETVWAIIQCLGARPDDEVDCPDGTRRSLWQALSEACEIGRPTDEAIEVLASRAPRDDESQRLQALAEGYPGAEPADADLLELLETFPSARPPVQELVSVLGVLQPRLYSIASSPKAEPRAVHLTVSAVRYRVRGRARKGIASTFLADRLSPGAAVPVFTQRPVHGFGLPRSSDAPIIMIGPGTGIAPFRAFLQERQALGARGRNWLFFGDQHRASDFLYETELTAWHKDGLLTRLDLAFSRDQPERLYVQQRMREQAKELWAWLEEGAYLYVCGAARMGRDVDTALAAIVARQGGMGSGAAKTFLSTLGRAGRYQKDVY